MNANKEIIAKFRKAFGLDQGYSLLLLEHARDIESLLSPEKERFSSVYALYLAAREEKLITRIPPFVGYISDPKHCETRRYAKGGNHVFNIKKEINEADRVLRNLAPSEDSSFSYRIYYFKTAFAKWLEYLEKETLSKKAQLELTLYAREWFIESCLEITEQVFLSIKGMVLNSLLTQRLKSNKPPFDEFVDRSLLMLLNKDVNRDTLEYLKFLAQFYYFEEIIDTDKTQDEEVIRDTTVRLAYKLANIIYKYGFSVKTGILLAKHGIKVRDCSERQDAFNILGLLASDLYGAKQLSYDAYYSWLHMKVVGEIEQLLEPDFFNNIEEAENRWRQSREGTSAVALMYNNYAYICAGMGDSYGISDPLHSSFYSIAKAAAEKAITTVEAYIEKSYNNDVRHNYLASSLRNSSLTEVASFYCTLGSVLRDGVFRGSPDKNSRAISAYEKIDMYYSEAKNNGYQVSYEYWLNGCYGMVESILGSIIYDQLSTENTPAYQDRNSKKWGNLFEAIERYYTLDVPEHDRESQTDLQEREDLRPVMQFLKEARKIISFPSVQELQNIAQSLLIIWHCAKGIEEFLINRNISPVNYHTRENDTGEDSLSVERKTKPIAYYTTIRTASYIFENLIQEEVGIAPKVDNNIRDGKNCLTVVHAKNMNDPYEGLTLLNSFQAVISEARNIILPKGSETVFREKLYEKTYVFLRSFTDSIDTLVMWNRYASDYDSDGRNSNGCCIEFAPECFHRLTDSAEKTLVNSDDISQLYQVIYLSDNYTIEDIHNRHISELNTIKRLYTLMRSELTNINENVITICSSKAISSDEAKNRLISLIWSALSAALSRTIFLFKSDSYSEEHESRLIYTRNQTQTDSIRVLEGDPKKLAINPYFQVYIKRVVFGPNVRNSDGWKPFFQYQLSRMWEKSDSSNNNKKSSVSNSFSIENSKIHYRT